MPEDRTMTIEPRPSEAADPIPRGLAAAGFWRRAAAAAIDTAIVAPVWVAATLVSAHWSLGGRLMLEWGTGIALWLGYWAAFEASRWGATPGKRAMGLAVVDVDGEPIGPGVAAGRNLAKLASTFPLLLGYAAAGWTRRKQALHDLLADTLVVRRREPAQWAGLAVAGGVAVAVVLALGLRPLVGPAELARAPVDPCGDPRVFATDLEEQAPSDLPLPGGFAVREVGGGGISVELIAPRLPGAEGHRVIREHFAEAGLRIGGPEAFFTGSYSYRDKMEGPSDRAFFMQHPYGGIVWRVVTSPCSDGAGTEVFLDAAGY